MFGWSIRARACRSASNRASTCLRVHPRLDQLDGDRPLDRLGLLGHPDRAHPALADLLEQLVPADRPRRGARRPAAGRAVAAGTGGRLEEAAGIARGRAQQRLDPPPQGRRRRRRPASRKAGPVGRAAAPGRPGRCLRRRRSAVMAAVAGRWLRTSARIAAADRLTNPENVGRSRPVAAVSSAVQPGPGVRPVAVGGRAGRCRGPSAASSTVSPAKYRSLTSRGLGRVARGRAGSGPRPGRAGRRPAPGRRRRRRPGRPRAPPAAVLAGRLRRALSTRMRRMASAAAAKKWPRPSQCRRRRPPTSRR